MRWCACRRCAGVPALPLAARLALPWSRRMQGARPARHESQSQPEQEQETTRALQRGVDVCGVCSCARAAGMPAPARRRGLNRHSMSHPTPAALNPTPRAHTHTTPAQAASICTRQGMPWRRAGAPAPRRAAVRRQARFCQRLVPPFAAGPRAHRPWSSCLAGAGW